MPTKKKTTAKKITKKGSAKIVVGIKDANNDKVIVGQATGEPPKVIKMLKSLANQRGSYPANHTFNVPHDVPVPTARNWVRSGAAEVIEE